MLLPKSSLESAEDQEVYDLDEFTYLVVKRDHEEHPLVNLKLSERVPCLDINKI